MNNKIILGSSSPRRAELLKKNNIDFEVKPSDYIEIIEQDLLPQNIVLKLALGKGLEVSNSYPDYTIISADTIVVFKNHKLGKPDNYLELKQWLHSFSGNVVDIWTGSVVIKNGKVYAQADLAQVKFRILNNSEIESYLNDPEADWMDKAGGFAVQGKAKDFVSYNEKEFDIILGLNTEFVKRSILLQ
ncbi:MAG: Maf family nucleotide pyrophosphatase [Patescibacteria group bacterium]